MASNDVTIRPLREATALFFIRNLPGSPMVQHKFSEKALKTIIDDQTKEGAKKRKKPPRDLSAEFLDATHVGDDGTYGFPAGGLRNAMIRACKGAGFVMTDGKLGVHVEADMIDARDGTPLFRIEGEPGPALHPVRLRGVTSIACRSMFKTWRARVRITYDEDMFSLQNVTDLLVRAGRQVGLGEGRPFSTSSGGMNWGRFDVVPSFDEQEETA